MTSPNEDVAVWVMDTWTREVHKAGGGNPQGLIDWYNDGAGGQIDWGTPGDFDQCVAVAGQYIDDPEGFCQLRHMDATGVAAGRGSAV